MSNTASIPIAIIDSRSGEKMIGYDKPFILKLAAGENLFESILRCANDAKLPSASISGLGGLDDVSVAYYNLKTQQYQTKLFTGMYELISLNGNITVVEEQRFIHIHAALGTEEYNVIGGHIMSAIVNPTVELTIIPLASPIYRQFDAASGLKLMCTKLSYSSL
ncbi:MAG: DUF296 domain-containing protein [Gammaproteobacteria bacterium]|nr:MAG: DUF296 domain-containing protein [Gammaproteobacteria bacterium]